MNSDILKNAVLSYFRFKRQYTLCATEVNTGIEIADILLNNGSEIIEIEIKVSYSDFLADFKKRKHKNIKYFLKANKFYFCVPSGIKNKCLEYLQNKKLPYGLYSFNGTLNLIKRCKKLNNLSEGEIAKINDYIIRRATSELIILRKEKINRLWDGKKSKL